MKVLKWLPALAGMCVLAGCGTTVKDIESTPETLSVISGKPPKEYAACMSERLAKSRDPATLEYNGEKIRMIFAQKLSSDPAAVVDISERNHGSSVRLHERLTNLPVKSDVYAAATHCISN